MSASDVTYADFADCLILNTIRTARAVSRRYDNQLSAFGVTVVQFSVLVTIREFEGMTINALAARMAMDRSTLTRNVDVLIRHGHVEKQETGKGNARTCRLTASGNALLDRLIPEWVAVRQKLRESLTGIDLLEYLATLRKLAGT